jgi:hypothetical protein
MTIRPMAPSRSVAPTTATRREAISPESSLIVSRFGTAW